MKLSILPAVPADAPALAEIHARSWEAAYKGFIPHAFMEEKNKTRPTQWQRILTAEHPTHYALWQDDKIAGFLCIAPPQDTTLGEGFYELHALYLHPDYFRRGIGTQAVAFAIEKVRSLGKKTMVLWCLAANTSGLSFYKKCGFLPDGAEQTVNYGVPLRSIRLRRNL